MKQFLSAAFVLLMPPAWAVLLAALSGVSLKSILALVFIAYAFLDAGTADYQSLIERDFCKHHPKPDFCGEVIK